jgi:hypothetical protein
MDVLVMVRIEFSGGNPAHLEGVIEWVKMTRPERLYAILTDYGELAIRPRVTSKHVDSARVRNLTSDGYTKIKDALGKTKLLVFPAIDVDWTEERAGDY